MGNLISDPPDVDYYKRHYEGKTPTPEIPEPSEAEWKKVHVHLLGSTVPVAPWDRSNATWDQRNRFIHLRAKARVEAGGVLIVVDEGGTTTGYSPGHYSYFTVSPSAGE